MFSTIFSFLYAFAVAGLSIFGLQSLIFASIFFISRRQQSPIPPDPEQWPGVTVQLPVYNEEFVIERLIQAACAFDYPSESLCIQVLDDSTDETTELARRQVELMRACGVNIQLFHRSQRAGFKAGALAHGLSCTPNDFVAVFDADFLPPADFLKRMLPHLLADARLGMVQARWGHLNADYSLLTRGQALYLDGHMVIEQTVRSRSGLLFNFNGSAGIWRRACIEDAGGWQADTLAEDLDLSYRAQLLGWKLLFLPEVVAPAEIPPQITSFKRQQYRWTRGAFEVLVKLGSRLWREPLTLAQRMGGSLHLGLCLVYPLMLLLLLSSLPLILTERSGLPFMGWVSVAGLGPPALFGLSQWSVYPDWKRRLLYLPILLFLGIGLGLSNTAGLVAALCRRPASFTRTPKYRLESKVDGWRGASYQLAADWTLWGELALSVYSLATFCLALIYLPGLAPVLALYTLGFGFVALAGLYQQRAQLAT